MRSWGHGHSLAAGALLAVSMERHALVVLAAVFAVGFAAGRFWAAGAGLARAALWRLRGARRRRIYEREIPF